MNSQIFVADTVSQIKSIQELSVNELGLYILERGSGRTTNASPTSDADSFFFVDVRPDGNKVLSRFFNGAKGNRTGVKNLTFKKLNFRQATGDVINLTSQSIGTSDYDEWTVTLSLSAGFEQGSYGIGSFKRSWSVTGKFVTHAALYAAIATELNRDRLFVQSVTSDGAGVQITTKPAQAVTVGFNFSKDTSGGDSSPYEINSTGVTYAGTSDAGIGTGEHLAKLGEFFSIWSGSEYTHDRRFKVASENYGINPVGQYDMLHLLWSNDEQREGDQGDVFKQQQQLFIAMPVNSDMNYLIQTLEKLLATKVEYVS